MQKSLLELFEAASRQPLPYEGLSKPTFVDNSKLNEKVTNKKGTYSHRANSIAPQQEAK